MAATTLAYVAGMQDDEAYKNATPEERAMNWFVYVPGLDDPVRIPIPFEIGYVFKAVPEALYNMATGAQTVPESRETLNRILINTLPGGSNMPVISMGDYLIPVPIPIPQALKPAIEAGSGVSMFTRRDIVPGNLQGVLPPDQYNERTSEVAKDLGQLFGMSPILIENTVRGYNAALGPALMQLTSMAYADSGGPERAVRRLSELPLVGAGFQPRDGTHLINNAYDLIKNIAEVKASYERRLQTGNRAEAELFLQENLDKLSAASVSGNMREMLNKVSQAENAVKASNMTAQEKRQQLDELRQVKLQVAGAVREALGTR
jgi:hypothetical protein